MTHNTSFDPKPPIAPTLCRFQFDLRGKRSRRRMDEPEYGAQENALGV